MSHRLFVDEVGNAGMSVLSGPNERYLCLAGTAFELGHLVRVVEPAIEALKAEFFQAHTAATPLIFHRKELFAARRPFAELKIGDAHDRFNAKLLSLLTSFEFTLIIVIIDKYAHATRYDRPHHPYHYCMSAMLERYVGFLVSAKSTGDVLAEGRGRKEDAALCSAFAENVRVGSQWSSDAIRTRLNSHTLGIATKTANDAGLQITDMVAYPCFRRALARHVQAEALPGGFSGQVAEAMKAKLRRSPGGSIRGYGLKWLP
jgi:hypothetical protein